MYTADAQVQAYRQQRSLQEQEQLQRERQWELERFRRHDPRLDP